MSAKNRDKDVDKAGSEKVPNKEREIEDIDPCQDPTRPAATRPEVAAETGRAKEEANTQKPAPGAAKEGKGPFAPRDIDPDQDGTRPC